MRNKLILSGLSLVVMSIGATAQTTVTNNNNGTVNTVPVYTASATLGSNSPISVSGSNVGIGTTSPSRPLEVGGGGIERLTGANPALELNGTYAPIPNIAQIQIRTAGELFLHSNYLNTSISDWQLKLGTGTGPYPDDAFYVARAPSAGGTAAYFMVITNSGHVGIGTSSPAYSLDVAGLIHTSTAVVFPDGSQQTTAWTGTVCGGDYAESVDAAGKHNLYVPGDILVLTSDGKGDVEKSSEPYSTMVAGIYATKPGVVGRRISLPKSADDVPMALIGIVPTKVSAENGSIRRGDLLVSSSTPGYAMKGTDRERMLGAVVGKAMGSLESGKGVIEVLVTLQ